MYVVFFICNVMLCAVCLVSVKHALNIKLDYEDTRHGIHLIAYIVLTFSTIFMILYSFVQHGAITVPVKHIREYLSKIREGNFDSKLDNEKTLLDISEFNPIIDDINITVDELKSMQNLSTDFVNYISHEFKTPLTVVQNYSKLIQDENTTDEKRLEYAKIIESSVDDLNSLVSNALKLNRIEHQNIYPNKEKFNLCEELAQTIISLESKIEEKQINLDVQLEDSIIISSEKELSSHIWLNLISNAIKFTDVGGYVLIKSEVVDNMAVVTIADNGCGISEKDKPFIYDRYFRGNNSSKAKGNGLGLSLVKKICDALGMGISFESTQGEGTCFVITVDL